MLLLPLPLLYVDQTKHGLEGLDHGRNAFRGNFAAHMRAVESWQARHVQAIGQPASLRKGWAGLFDRCLGGVLRACFGGGAQHPTSMVFLLVSNLPYTLRTAVLCVACGFVMFVLHSFFSFVCSPAHGCHKL